MNSITFFNEEEYSGEFINVQMTEVKEDQMETGDERLKAGNEFVEKDF